MKPSKCLIAAAGTTLSVILAAADVSARDLGIYVLPIHKGSLTSSLVYDHFKLEDDFNTRGRAVFKAHAVGAVFSYGVTDTVAVAVKGATIVNSRVEAQGNAWESRAGFLYGLDLYNEVFPSTELRPGVVISGGLSQYQVPLTRADVNSSGMTPIDQNMTGTEYHGSVVATYRFGRLEPYAGLRGFGSTVIWRNNASGAAPDHITGHAHGNVSVVAGLPVRVAKDVRLVLEGRFVSETTISAALTIASF